MKRFLIWWYGIALPQRGPDTNPHERERTRYARLTCIFLLIFIVIFVPLSPIMIFDSPMSPSSPPIAIGMLACLAGSFILGRLGRNIPSAAFIILYNMLSVTGPLATNPLDPSLLPLFGVFSIAVILAGALMPPVAALVVGILGSLDIILLTIFVPHTLAYNTMMSNGLFTITLILPVALQLIAAVITFVIMRNLIATIRRADRAEEIVALQQQVTQHIRSQVQQKQQLEDGFRRIAETHARISNGDPNARVSLTEGHVLWNIAVPLNTLLNRVQRMKVESDMLMATYQSSYQVAHMLHQAIASDQVASVNLPPTGTPLDPVVLEINNMARKVSQDSSVPSLTQEW